MDNGFELPARAGVLTPAVAMARADGVVTQDEVRAFHRIFEIPPDEMRNVQRLYNLAQADTAGFETYAPWLMAQATDFLRGDVAFKGGITNMLKTAHLAEAFGMNYEIHHGSNSLGNVANLHVACAIHNCEYFEVLLPDANNRYGLVQDIPVGPDGQVRVPDGPGLGVEVDMDLVRRRQVAVLREKNKAMETRMAELIRIGQQNDAIGAHIDAQRLQIFVEAVRRRRCGATESHEKDNETSCDARHRDHGLLLQGIGSPGTITIHCRPKRSVTMP